ncbi:MAG TPA: CAP domain-containing protein [Sphingomicrobium sp.]|nr:CAP domain-containing protein [Sphingomicrobium sp.]
MRAALLTALVLILPAAAIAVPQRLTHEWDGRSKPRGEALMRSTVIAAHNRARAQYGVRPLVWDEALARDARTYAMFLARTGRFEHDPRLRGRASQGENLWMGTRTAYSYAQVIGQLVDERRFYRPGRFPHVSRTGDWSHVSHYTQIIWPTSQRVGCATASNRDHDYLVCRYWPAGNIVGTVLR